MTGYDDPIKLTIHYTGKRFDDHTVPVTLLEDLGTIQEMILEVASEIFKRKSGTKGSRRDSGKVAASDWSPSRRGPRSST